MFLTAIDSYKVVSQSEIPSRELWTDFSIHVCSRDSPKKKLEMTESAHGLLFDMGMIDGIPQRSIPAALFRN